MQKTYIGMDKSKVGLRVHFWSSSRTAGLGDLASVELSSAPQYPILWHLARHSFHAGMKETAMQNLP